MATQILDPAWTPQGCPAGTEIWQIFFTSYEEWAQLGPIAATSDCAPPYYTATSPYLAYSCPIGYSVYIGMYPESESAIDGMLSHVS